MSHRKRKQPLTVLPELEPWEPEELIITVGKNLSEKKTGMTGKENLKKSSSKKTTPVRASIESDSDDDDVWRALKKSGIRTQSARSHDTEERNHKVKNDARKQLFIEDAESPVSARKRKSSKSDTAEVVPKKQTIPVAVESNLNDFPRQSTVKIENPDGIDLVSSMRNKLSRRLNARAVKQPDTPPSPLRATPRKSRDDDPDIRRKSHVTPVSRRKSIKCETPKTPLEEARSALHVSAVPDCLPCREAEYNNVLTFVENKIIDGVGGCMYISGVPGTGKTATVTQVIRHLQSLADLGKFPSFKYVEINGMRLSDPRQAYVQLYKEIFNKSDRVSADIAHKKLETYFQKSDKSKVSTVVLVDELDLMCTRKQDVVYNLLDWPSKSRSRLIVLTIANTMDMPERKLKGRINSRLGLTRLTFSPYTYKQLEEIVRARLEGSEAFTVDAVRLAARKVAAVSGDARRALDICRRAAELPDNPNDPVRISHIEQAVREMTNSNIVRIIRSCSEMEKLLLQSVSDVCVRTGVDEVDIAPVLEHAIALGVLEGYIRPAVPALLSVCQKLKCTRLIYTSNHRGGLNQRLTLNITQDDLHYALKVDEKKILNS